MRAIFEIMQLHSGGAMQLFQLIKWMRFMGIYPNIPLDLAGNDLRKLVCPAQTRNASRLSLSLCLSLSHFSLYLSLSLFQHTQYMYSKFYFIRIFKEFINLHKKKNTLHSIPRSSLAR